MGVLGERRECVRRAAALPVTWGGGRRRKGRAQQAWSRGAERGADRRRTRPLS